MNHLAHTILSCDDQDLLLGNLVTDMLNKKEADAMHPDLQKGIQLHRLIDRFMDKHELTKEAKAIIRPTQGKYASVSIDLLWDFYLVKNWEKYSPEKLAAHKSQIYKMIKAGYPYLNEKLQLRFDNMINSDFLGFYSSRENFNKVLKRMDQRANFKSDFVGLNSHIDEDSDDLEKLFNDFFPLIIEEVRSFCDC